VCVCVYMFKMQNRNDKMSHIIQSSHSHFRILLLGIRKCPALFYSGHWYDFQYIGLTEIYCSFLNFSRKDIRSKQPMAAF
jgi:hypothetical protein